MDSLFTQIESLKPLLRMIAAGLGAATALLVFSLAVWTYRDVAARTRDGLVRAGALILVLALPLFGLITYLLLRPRETIAERYEREMIEELLAREVTSGALARRAPRAGAPTASPG
jgi:hypothetical protein